MEKRGTSIFDIILNTIIILLVILVVYWAIELLFGGSLTLPYFNFSLIILMAGFMIKMYREIGEIKVGMKYGFREVKRDMGLIKDKLEISEEW